VELDHLVALASASNLDEVARIAHQIKGSGGSFGFTGLTEIGADLEQAAKAANLVAVGRCLADLGSYLKRVEIVNA
jgi:HPt (histidine-containing phosphotransfer) domain-containing protein